jgi:hypothetical protein
MAREEHGRRLDVIRRQVENPEVAEAVARDRESRRESLRSPKRETPPREVDRLKRPALDPCRLLEERAKLTGQRNADLIRKALDVVLR